MLCILRDRGWTLIQRKHGSRQRSFFPNNPHDKVGTRSIGSNRHQRKNGWAFERGKWRQREAAMARFLSLSPSCREWAMETKRISLPIHLRSPHVLFAWSSSQFFSHPFTWNATSFHLCFPLFCVKKGKPSPPSTTSSRRIALFSQKSSFPSLYSIPSSQQTPWVFYELSRT